MRGISQCEISHTENVSIEKPLPKIGMMIWLDSSSIWLTSCRLNIRCRRSNKSSGILTQSGVIIQRIVVHIVGVIVLPILRPCLMIWVIWDVGIRVLIVILSRIHVRTFILLRHFYFDEKRRQQSENKSSNLIGQRGRHSSPQLVFHEN